MLVAQVRLLFSTCFLNSELRLLFHSLDFSDSGMEGKLGHKWQDMANGEFPLFVLGTFFNFFQRCNELLTSLNSYAGHHVGVSVYSYHVERISFCQLYLTTPHQYGLTK